MMTEFITMAPTSGDSEFIGIASKDKKFNKWTGTDVNPDRQPSLEYIKEVAVAAERGGFSTLLLPVGGNCIDSIVAASHLAAFTEKINLLFAVRPGTIPPTQLAKQFVSLDYWTGGRVFFNVVTGGSPAELAKDGDFLSHEKRYKRTREYIQILKRLFAGETFDFDGEFYKLKGASLLRLPEKTPPIFFGGSSPIAKEVASELADVYMLWGETLENTREELRSVQELARQKGRTLSYSISFQVITGDTEEEAWKKAEKLISKADPEVIAAKHKNTLANGAVGVQRLHRLMLESKERNFVIAPNIWAGLTQVLTGNSIALVGTPDQIAERLAEFIRLGFDKVLLRGFPHLEVIKEVGEKIIPRVRKILAQDVQLI